MTAKPGSARYEFLDALRGMAILAVMLLHFGETGVSADNAALHNWLWPVLSHGYLGVQLFFVISGYCITAAMYGAATKPKPLKTFAQRRIRRIFPPYWWSIALVAAMGLVTCQLMHKDWYDIFPMSLTDWLLNIVLLQELFHAPDPNLVYWSLSIELQFYAMMAICLLKLAWSEHFLMLISTLSFVSLTQHHWPISGTVLAYWPEFACGIAVYYFVTQGRCFALTPWYLLAASAATMVLVWGQNPVVTVPNGHATLPVKLLFCLFLTAVMVAIHPYDARLCQSRWFRWLSALGGVSYSLYLTHVPISTRVFNLGERLTGIDGSFWLLYFAAALAAALIFGQLFYRYCEHPWLNTSSTATVSDRSPTPADALAPAILER